MMRQHSVGTVLMHHADPPGVYHSCMVSMMLEYSPGELLARATFMHHGDKGPITLKHYAALKWLNTLYIHTSRPGW